VRNEAKKRVNRRQFLKRAGVVTISGMGCLAFGNVRDAIRQARATGKPLLTDAALNKFIKDNIGNWAKYQEMARQAKTDLASFLNKYFTLTKTQSDAIKVLGNENLKAIVKGIDGSMKYKTPLGIVFKGEANEINKGHAKVYYRETDTSTPGGGSSSTKEVGVEVDY